MRRNANFPVITVVESEGNGLNFNNWSTPHIAASTAALRERYPHHTWRQIRALVCQGVDLHTPPPQTGGRWRIPGCPFDEPMERKTDGRNTC